MYKLVICLFCSCGERGKIWGFKPPPPLAPKSLGRGGGEEKHVRTAWGRERERERGGGGDSREHWGGGGILRSLFPPHKMGALGRPDGDVNTITPKVLF